ncbi:collagen alpha-1(I) chain-like [Rousettus aegyptiacus]|uniref:collagen alpha-1(I) chain-like n=1 Tax=Rousettus aegyptiacus TaxID=9407 RepID=UPI00168D599C|nr:collagen alpha-1(I) chain-like [Rousettus aegyptiacus]
MDRRVCPREVSPGLLLKAKRGPPWVLGAGAAGERGPPFGTRVTLPWHLYHQNCLPSSDVTVPLFSEMALAGVSLSGHYLGFCLEWRVPNSDSYGSLILAAPCHVGRPFFVSYPRQGRPLGTAPGPTGALERGGHHKPIQPRLVRVALGSEPRRGAAPLAGEVPGGPPGDLGGAPTVKGRGMGSDHETLRAEMKHSQTRVLGKEGRLGDEQIHAETRRSQAADRQGRRAGVPVPEARWPPRPPRTDGRGMWRARRACPVPLEGVSVLGRGRGPGSCEGRVGATGSHWETRTLRTRGARSSSGTRSPAAPFTAWDSARAARGSARAGSVRARAPDGPAGPPAAPGPSPAGGTSALVPPPGPGAAGSRGHSRACEPRPEPGRRSRSTGPREGGGGPGTAGAAWPSWALLRRGRGARGAGLEPPRRGLGLDPAATRPPWRASPRGPPAAAPAPAAPREHPNRLEDA